MIQIFSDKYFRSLVTIRDVKLEKNEKNTWIVKVWIAKEFFYYAHPCILPGLSDLKPTKDELEVYFHCIQIFSSTDLEKKFLIREFLDSYPAVLSYQRKTKIKKLFLQFVASLEKYDLIESNYQIISDASLKDVIELTLSNISEGFILSEKLSFNSYFIFKT